MRIKIIATLFLALVTGMAGYSQRWKLIRYELVMGAGTTNVFGDIGGGIDRNNWFGIKDIRLDATRPSFLLALRYKFYQNLAGRFTLFYGMGAGTDAGAVNEYRGYSFTTTIIEPSVVAEYYFISEERRLKSAAIYSRRGMINNYSRIGAYVFGGVGGAYFNPKVSGVQPGSPAEWISGYTPVTVVLPAGLGIKYILSETWMVGFELGGRLSLSDFIDGYSADVSGNKALDIYYFTALNAVYRIRNNRENVPLFLQNIFNHRPRRPR